jgi:acyl dehydratase
VLKAFQKNAKMVHPGNTLTFFGSVTDKYEKNGLGYVELELGLRIEDGSVAVPGRATVVLPMRDGRPVPYPFVP